MGVCTSKKSYLSKLDSQLKLSITFGAFLALILLLGALILSGIIKDLRIVEQERRGLALITTIRPLLEYIPQYRGLCAVYQQGEPSFREPCLEAGQDVDRSIARLAQVDAFGIRRQIDAINKEWLRLKGQTFDLSPEDLFSKHSRLVAKVINLGRDASENSRLIYDSNMGTHSLMDIAVFRLPALGEAIGQLRGRASAVAAAGWLDEKAAIELEILIDQMKRANVQLLHAIEKVGEQNPQRAKRLESPTNRLEKLIDEFRGFVTTEQLIGNYFDVSAKQLFDIGSRAIDATFQLYETVVLQLDEALLERKKRIERDLFQSAIVLVLASLLAAVLFLRLSRSLRRVEVSESRLSNIFKTVADGLVVSDEGGLIRSFNPSAEKIFGYSAGEIVGKNISILVPELSRAQHEGYIRNFHEAGGSRVIGVGREIRGRHKDGNTFPIELTVSSAVVRGKRLFTAVMRDITRRKQAEAELETQRHQIETINRAQSRFIVGGDPIAFFEGILPDILELAESEFGLIAEAMIDPEGSTYLKTYALTNIAWNEATRELYEKHSPQGLEFHNLDNLLGKVIRSGEQMISNDPANYPDSAGLPEGHPPLDAFLGVPVYLGRQLLGVIGLANRPGGYDESVVERLLPILNTCAQIFKAMGNERKKRHTALEMNRSNSFMSTLVENLQAGLLVEDEEGKIYALNQTYCDMFGKDALPLMIEGEEGDSEFEQNKALFSQPGALLQWRKQCMSNMVTITGQEWELLDGRVFEQDYIPIFFEDEQSQIHRSHLWSYRDISEHKQAQKTLAEAKESAEMAANAKSQFLATMSHEIRTPMNGVLGMLHLLGKTELKAPQRRYLNTATGSGEMLIKVINDILDISKLEAGKVELESIPFDLVPMLEESVSLLAKGAQENAVELLCSIDFDLPRTLKGDPTRLRQVLTNLINNAIKFTEQGDIVVYATRLDSGLIRFGVRDTGIGMTGEQQQQLFKVFSQVDSSHTRKYGGTGLGLAISQKLIMAMGSKIRVASSPGLGSDFSFDLSLEIVADNKTISHIPEALTRQRILVVDDNKNQLASMRRTLKQWEISHTGIAINGSEALAQLRAAAADEPYDIAILDLMMPGMDGLELARRIRADSALQGMKLMILSGIEQGAPAPEVDAWLTKPIQQSELFNNLLQLSGENSNELRDSQPVEEEREWWFGDSKLLLVEDNLVNQEVSQEILGAAGFDIDICDNGVEALQAVQEKAYDVVLMDIQMPVMDGLQATQAIRSLEGCFTELPIIAMTAHALGEDIDKSLAVGMNAHVTKPIDPEVLFKELSRWVKPAKKPLVKQIAAVMSEAMPDALPGVDLKDGLTRLNGNWVTYKRILLGFRNKHSGAADSLERFILHGKWGEATHLAHTLKGSGGNLGAKQLYKAAAAMEQACRKAEVDVDSEVFKMLRSSLAEVTDGLAVLEEAASSTSAEGANSMMFDSEAWRTSLDALVDALDTDLGEAQTCLESLRQNAAGSEYLDSLNELETALNAFDIDASKAITERLQIIHL